MFWVLIFLGIGFAWLISLVCYGIWLSHKASDLFSEIQVLATRCEEFIEFSSKLDPESSEIQK